MKALKRSIGIVILLMLAMCFLCMNASAAVEDYPVIAAGEGQIAQISEGGKYAYFAYTPQYTESHTFYSTGGSDTYGYLYDSEMNQLAFDDDGGENSNFSVTYLLEGGKTYIFGARYFSSSKIGDIAVMLQVNHSPDEGVITTAATCTENGVTTYTCTVCNEEYTEVIPAAHVLNEENICNVCNKVISAQGICGANLNWSLDDEGTLTISGEGTMSSWAFDDVEDIKKVIISNGVTSIGYGAFYGCSSLTAITIPDSVTSIGECAFSGCSSLTTITIPDGVTSISSNTFWNCSSLTTISIPDSVTSIGDWAFYDCSSLTTISIPDSVTSIGYSAFAGCSSLTMITIPDGVTSIGESAFFNCSNLTTVTIPDSVTSIGNYVFRYCSSLTTITIPDSVTSIGYYAFSYCSSLTTISIPDSVTSIGDGAFAGCSSLTAISVSAGNPEYSSKNGVLYNKSQDNLLLCPEGKSGEFVILIGVTSIGDRAFENCSSLTTITIPDSVKLIGSRAFAGCSSLTTITIPDSVTSISDWMFFGCGSLTSVTIPNSVTIIRGAAFENCSSLTEITIPDSVTAIDSYAFSGCTKLTSMVIPNSVTSIAYSAFSDCKDLSDVELPKSLKSIPDSLFFGCSSLTSITIPDSVTSISSAFFGCGSLTTITIPDSVTSIGPYAFVGCSGLTRVTFLGSAPDFGDDVFYDVTATAHYPANDATWTEDVMQDYGGDITWMPYTPSVTITTQIKNTTAAEGKTATVQVEAEGDGLTYEWYYANAGSTKFTKTSSFTGNTYSVEMTAARNGRQVYCVITDQYGNSVQTETVTLTMQTPLEITTQPKTAYAYYGNSAKATVTAVGDGLTYQWYIRDVDDTKYTKSSIKTDTYSLKMTEANSNRRAYCIVTDQYGNSVRSDTACLRLRATITGQPAHASAAEGSTVKTKVTAVGEGLTYQWYIKNPGKTSFSKSSVTSATYSCKMSSSVNGRQAYCVVTDKYGKTAKSNTVTLGLPVKITTQPKTTYTKSGAQAITTVVADGDGLTYQWYIKDVGGTTYTKSSITSATYSTTMNSARKDRLAYCIVTDKYGNSVKADTVRLRMAATITTQPKSVKVASGSIAKTTVTAVGDGLTYTWYIKNPGKTSFSKSSVTGAAYSCKMSSSVNGRQAYCVVTDKYGKTAKSNTVTLSMK